MSHEDFRANVSTHPDYIAMIDDWSKWRLSYEGGTHFLESYLEKFSKRETEEDFKKRKKVTPVAAHAKAAVNEIVNAIFERISAVVRKDGPDTYQIAVKGQEGGVDLRGRSMNAFIGRSVLPELLTLGKVGIYVDMPELLGPTLIDKGANRPYLYTYRAEDIRSWDYKRNQEQGELRAVLLRDWVYDTDPHGLPSGIIETFRKLWIDEDTGRVNAQFFDSEGIPLSDVIELNLTKIPLVILEITNSIMSDISTYQIALMNMESSDVAFALTANYPFYTEQTDEKAKFLKRSTVDSEGKATDAGSNDSEIKVGTTVGRTYGRNLERPGFIHPSSEPFLASIEKQRRMKEDIRQLANLALSTIQPKMASAESKALDQEGLQSGLAAVGLELERAERKVAMLWSAYEGSKTISMVNYPERWSLRSEEERRRDAKELSELAGSVPSKKYQKEITKRVARVLLEHKILPEELEQIEREIDRASFSTSDPEIIASDLERGLVSLETASKARGYAEGEVEKAKEDHAERLARIKEAQSDPSARGNPDESGNPQAGQIERQAANQTDQDGVVTDKTRGEGK